MRMPYDFQNEPVDIRRGGVKKRELKEHRRALRRMRKNAKLAAHDKPPPAPKYLFGLVVLVVFGWWMFHEDRPRRDSAGNRVIEIQDRRWRPW